MSEEFLSPDELSKKLGPFKDKWFGIAEKSEAFSDYKSGFDTDFEKAVIDLKERVASCGGDIKLFSLSVEHHIPESRKKIKGLSASIIHGLDHFKDTLNHDLDALDGYNSLKPKLSRLERELSELDNSYNRASDHAERTYKEYTAKKIGYEKQVQKIKASTENVLSGIKERFVSDFDSDFEGFELVTKTGDKKIAPQTLFNSLIDDLKFAERIKIVPKGLGGLLGSKQSELEVRKVLFEYKIRDLIKEVSPFLDEKKKKLGKYEAEITHIEELKKTSQKLEEDTGEIEDEKEEVQKKIEKLTSKSEKVMSKFLNYEDILDLREGYLKLFNDINTEKKKLFKLMEDAIKTYEPPEHDLEKRELREEIASLTQEIEKHKRAEAKLKKEHENLAKKYRSTRAVLDKKSKEVGRLVASVKEGEGKVKTLEKKAAELEKSLENTSKSMSLTQKKLETAENKVENYKLDIESEKELRSKSEKENKRLKAGLKKTISKLENSVEQQSKLNKELKRQKMARVVLETKYKKIVRDLKILKNTTPEVC